MNLDEAPQMTPQEAEMLLARANSALKRSLTLAVDHGLVESDQELTSADIDGITLDTSVTPFPLALTDEGESLLYLLWNVSDRRERRSIIRQELARLMGESPHAIVDHMKDLSKGARN